MEIQAQGSSVFAPTTTEDDHCLHAARRPSPGTAVGLRESHSLHCPARDSSCCFWLRSSNADHARLSTQRRVWSACCSCHRRPTVFNSDLVNADHAALSTRHRSSAQPLCVAIPINKCSLKPRSHSSYIFLNLWLSPATTGDILLLCCNLCRLPRLYTVEHGWLCSAASLSPASTTPAPTTPVAHSTRRGWLPTSFRHHCCLRPQLVQRRPHTFAHSTQRVWSCLA